MDWEFLAAAFGQPAQYDVIKVVVITMVVVVLLVLVMVATIMSMRKHLKGGPSKRDLEDPSLNDLLNTAPPAAGVDITHPVVEEEEEMSILPPEPQDPVEVYRRESAAENFARHEACRIFAFLPRAEDYTPFQSAFGKEAATRDPKSDPEVWVVAGPGELGSQAMAIARHLDTLGVPVAIQQVGATDRLRPDAKREFHTADAAQIQVFPSPRHRAPSCVSRIVVGVERELLAQARALEFDQLMDTARAGDTPLELIDRPVTEFVPPVPEESDVVVPVPDAIGTQEDARVLDFLASSQYKMIPVTLMENAGFWAARETWLYAETLKVERKLEEIGIAVLCGRGNNGGDGFVLSRFLHQWGATPHVFLIGTREMTTEDNRRNLELLEREGVKITPLLDPAQLPRFTETLRNCHIAVDALLGTGLDGKVRGPATVLIKALQLFREKGIKVISLDCPSGLDCNTGEPLGSSAIADLTITFGVNKTGLVNEKGAPLCGRVITVPIGLPRDAYRRKGLWPPKEIAGGSHESKEEEKEPEAAEVDASGTAPSAE
jgi:NAD(P)H-hydrate epimerase